MRRWKIETTLSICLIMYSTSSSTGTSRLQSFWPDCKHRSSQRTNRYWHHSLLEGIHYFAEGSICYFLCSSISFWWLPWRFEVMTVILVIIPWNRFGTDLEQLRLEALVPTPVCGYFPMPGLFGLGVSYPNRTCVETEYLKSRNFNCWYKALRWRHSHNGIDFDGRMYMAGDGGISSDGLSDVMITLV
jgi:hypothetical protein